MDLKIKDVADLLNVSETTIRRWLSDGKIPAYRINHQYRFNRLEIEDWVMAKRINRSAELETSDVPAKEESEDEGPQAKGGRQQFSLYRAIHQGGVLIDVKGATKEELIRKSMQQVADGLNLDPEVIAELLFQREKLQSTALNHGIALPHTRESIIQNGKDVVFVVFPEKPIDYDALDGELVHTLFFLFASDDKKHLHLLAKIAHFSSQENACAFLKTKPNKEQLLKFIKGWEGNIQKVLGSAVN